MRIIDVNLNNLIKKNIWTNPNYFWEFEGNKIPRLIPEGARHIDECLDIENNHNDLLKQNESLPNVKEFKKILRDYFPNLKVIEEYPIPIKKDRWKLTCKFNQGMDSSEENKNWFSLDFYFPEYGRVIQLDSIIGHGSPEQKIRDKAEDNYLRSSYNLKTFRTSQLQFPEKIEEETERIVKEINSWRKPNYNFGPLDSDYEEIFLDFIFSYYKEEIKFLEEELGPLWYKDGDPIINRHELSEDDQNIENRANSFIMKGVMLTFEESLKYFYRTLTERELIIK